MVGVILAGGHGTRLKPLTDITNKHLIAVYDKPMIWYPLNTLINLGIKNILIVSGREHAGHFIEYLGSGEDFDVNLTYMVQEKAGGIAEALGLAKDFANNESVTVILGDNYFDSINKSVYDICAKESKNGTATIYIKKVDDPERFGVAEIEDSNKIISIEEKPEKPKSQFAVTGLYIYPNNVFDVIKTLKPSRRGELEISDVNSFYIKQGELSFATIVTGFWSDMGTLESLGETIKYIINKNDRLNSNS